MRITPKNELEFRYRRLQQLMAEDALDAVIMTQNADLFYFTGTIQSGALYVPAEGAPLYMVRKNFSRARMESGLKEVLPFSSMSDIPSVIAEYGYAVPARIGMELDVLPVNLFERYREVFPAGQYLDAAPLIRKVRMIKSHYEIHILQDAALQVDKVYRRAKELIREGLSDLDLAAELEYAARREGHQGLIRMRGFNGEIFYAHIFSGADTAVPAYVNTPLGGVGLSPAFGQGASYNRIARNVPVIVDFAGCFDGYVVDQTRVFVLGGLSDRLAKGYDDMLLIQERMMRMAPERPFWGTIYDECAALAISMGYADNFMGFRGAQVSFIGHGIGIELDEYPFLAKGFHSMRLEPGMVFAFEPKLVFPGEGAIGIENTFYLTESGLNRLTFSPDDLVIL